VFSDTSRIREICSSPVSVGDVSCPNGVGLEANLACGSFVRFTMRIDEVSRQVEEIKFRSNGCEHMIAAAEVLAGRVSGNTLDSLSGLNEQTLYDRISESLGSIEVTRANCARSAISALRKTFRDHRSRRVEEFLGDSAVVCTCFGITETTIDALIDDNKLESVEDVTDACNAGGGCGSCRMLIEQMLDVRGATP
jgi:NifU-like protein